MQLGQESNKGAKGKGALRVRSESTGRSRYYRESKSP